MIKLYRIISRPTFFIACVCNGINNVLWEICYYRLGPGPIEYRNRVPFDPFRTFMDGFRGQL